jgi:hypothetical protein
MRGVGEWTFLKKNLLCTPCFMGMLYVGACWSLQGFLSGWANNWVSFLVGPVGQQCCPQSCGHVARPKTGFFSALLGKGDCFRGRRRGHLADILFL